MNFFDGKINTRNVVRLSIIVAALSFCISYSYAFGGAAKNDVAYLEGSESAQFVMLFWGDSEEIELFVKSAPENWAVIIEPSRFFVSKDAGDEYVSTGSGYTKATLVNVFAKTDSPNTGSILIGATSRKQGSGIAVEQEILFSLTVKSSAEVVSQETKVISQTSVQNTKNNTENKSGEQKSEETNLLYVIILIIIFIVSFIIYKKS